RDPGLGGVDLFLVRGGDLHGAVAVDVDLGAGLFDDLADDLAARADDVADLVGRNLDRLDLGRELTQLGAGAVDGLVHLVEDVQTAGRSLGDRLAHDLFGDARDLDVHLQRGDAFARAGHLEVHVAQVIFV